VTGLPPISTVARDLGAPEIKDGRCAAWFRGGSNARSVKFDDVQGVGIDFGTGKGFGCVGLAQMVQGCGPREAGAWLRRQYGLAKPDAAMRQRREQARTAAADLDAFVNRLRETVFAEIRNPILAEWHKAERFYRGPRRIGDLPASEWRRLRERLKLADGIDQFMRHVEQLPAAELRALRDRLIEVPA
jgi:hypothetical protein